MTTLAIVDLETTGTDPTRHHLWEIGLIVRTLGGDPATTADTWTDAEYCWQVRPDLTTADPMALKISRYYSRFREAVRAGSAHVAAHPDLPADSNPGEVRRYVSAAQVACEVAHLLDGAVLANANVGFDAAFLATFLRANGQAPAWDYHLLEVESYAAGAIGMPPPWKLDTLATVLGVKLPTGRHSALADARLARDVYDAARKQGARGWAGGVRWAADEADAQAAGREPVCMVDVTDHLRACADNPNRGTAVPR